MKISKWSLAPIAALTAAPAAAHEAGRPAPRVQTAVEALAQDAREYARHHNVGLDEAMRRLRAQEESVAATDRIRERFKDRLAGISIEHGPAYRIVVLLTGSEPVADEAISAGGMTVPVVFRTGARATRDQIIAAIWQHREAIKCFRARRAWAWTSAPASWCCGCAPPTPPASTLPRSTPSSRR